MSMVFHLQEPGARRPPLFRGAEAFRGPISSTPRKQPRLADPLGVQGDLMGKLTAISVHRLFYIFFRLFVCLVFSKDGIQHQGKA